jgi:hypothetical protein
MVIFWTLFVSGYQMALAAILLKTNRKPDKTGQKVQFSNGRTI